MSHTQNVIDMLTVQELIELKQQIELEIRRRNRSDAQSRAHAHDCPARFSNIRSATS